LLSTEPCNATLQKFIKSKGRKPSITRLFWRLPAGGGGSKSVVGWSISGVHDFSPPPTSPYATAAAAAKKHSHNQGKRENITAAEMALFHPLTPEEELAAELKNHLYLGPSERTQFKVKDAKNFAAYGHHNVCSLTNNDGVVTDAEMDKISPFKMSPVTLEDPETYTERIVSFLQKYAEAREGLLINVTEIVCDFIKDDNDKWWFIQLKGLRLCRRSRQQIHRWLLRKAEDDDSDFEDEGKESFQEQYKRKIREAREKAKENMDNQCKLCGIFYTEGELLSRSALEASDCTEDEERRLEARLLSQQKAEQQNYHQQQQQQQHQTDEEEEEGGRPATATTARLSMRGGAAATLPSSPDANNKSPGKSPARGVAKTKPRNPSFKELKKETDLQAIAQEEGVDVDKVSNACM
jgi:hypothetical protein